MRTYHVPIHAGITVEDKPVSIGTAPATVNATGETVIVLFVLAEDGTGVGYPLRVGYLEQVAAALADAVTEARAADTNDAPRRHLTIVPSAD
jgi:hypothetical protein